MSHLLDIGLAFAVGFILRLLWDLTLLLRKRSSWLTRFLSWCHDLYLLKRYPMRYLNPSQSQLFSQAGLLPSPSPPTSPPKPRQQNQLLVGYRVWELEVTLLERPSWDVMGRTYAHFRLGPLTALTNDFEWKQGVNEADCRSGSGYGYSPYHAAPHEGCYCGLWMKKDLAGLRTVAAVQPRSVTLPNPDTQLPWVTHFAVAGSVIGWGKCVVHEDGYRCQKAQIAYLFGPSDEFEITSSGYLYYQAVKALAEKLDVPMIDRFHIEAATQGLARQMSQPEEEKL